MFHQRRRQRATIFSMQDISRANIPGSAIGALLLSVFEPMGDRPPATGPDKILVHSRVELAPDIGPAGPGNSGFIRRPAGRGRRAADKALSASYCRSSYADALIVSTPSLAFSTCLARLGNQLAFRHSAQNFPLNNDERVVARLARPREVERHAAHESP